MAKRANSADLVKLQRQARGLDLGIKFDAGGRAIDPQSGRSLQKGKPVDTAYSGSPKDRALLNLRTAGEGLATFGTNGPPKAEGKPTLRDPRTPAQRAGAAASIMLTGNSPTQIADLGTQLGNRFSGTQPLSPPGAKAIKNDPMQQGFDSVRQVGQKK